MDFRQVSQNFSYPPRLRGCFYMSGDWEAQHAKEDFKFISQYELGMIPKFLQMHLQSIAYETSGIFSDKLFLLYIPG